MIDYSNDQSTLAVENIKFFTLKVYLRFSVIFKIIVVFYFKQKFI